MSQHVFCVRPSDEFKPLHIGNLFAWSGKDQPASPRYLWSSFGLILRAGSRLSSFVPEGLWVVSYQERSSKVNRDPMLGLSGKL